MDPSLSIAGSGGSRFIPIEKDDMSTEAPSFPPTNKSVTATLECNMWGSPTRVALEVFVLIMIVFNIAAAYIIFQVPVNIRGRHVAFLFICVRILNLLDLYQCLVILIAPVSMSRTCEVSRALCGLTGFLFATATIFSPVVAIIMAFDRAAAVFFHLGYKAHPRTKMKCAILGAVLLFYGFYFTLPLYTSFGEYVPVTWLAMCSFEWGEVHRIFNLVIAIITSLLSLGMIFANVAIVIRVHRRKQIANAKLHRSRDNLDSPRQLVETTTSQFITKSMHKSKSLDNLESQDGYCVASATTPTNSTLSTRRGVQPLKLLFRVGSVGKRSTGTFKSTASPKSAEGTINEDSAFMSPSPDPNKKHTLNGSCPQLDSPPSNDNQIQALLSPISPDENYYLLPPSPLVKEGSVKTTRMRTRQTVAGKTFTRLPSSESILSDDGKTSPQPPFNRMSRHGNPPDNLLRKTLHASVPVKDNKNGPLQSVKSPQSPETPLSPGISPKKRFWPRNTSVNSMLSTASDRIRTFNFGRSKEPKKHKISRITKMTTAVCTLFAILYVPFLTRKLVQLIPPGYRDVYVPRSIEIITLFLPLLSPLFNPILYVFFNPHYRNVLKKTVKKIKSHLKFESDVSVWGRRHEKKKSKSATENSESLPAPKQNASDQNQVQDDVFVADNSGDISPSYSSVGIMPSEPKEEKRRKSLREIYLRKLKG